MHAMRHYSTVGVLIGAVMMRHATQNVARPHASHLNPKITVPSVVRQR